MAESVVSTRTSHVNESVVYGRENDTTKLVNMLLLTESNLSIISIVGIGGIGKTILARSAFSDDRVSTNFGVRIWVEVSNNRDRDLDTELVRVRVAKEILESLEGVPRDRVAFDLMLQHLRQSISGKKFLIVLDDVWIENPRNWDILKDSLVSGSQGSKILVTTRKRTTAKAMGTEDSNMILLGPLSDECVWLLFSRVAYFGSSMEVWASFKYIAMEIVRRCEGLPLVVKTLGDLMQSKTLLSEWEGVLCSELWELEKVRDCVFRSLQLSYDDLHQQLKKCFLYCAIFPKNYKIKKDELIKLWSAQGYLDGDNIEDLELVGERYFQHLVDCSFFRDFETRECTDSIISCQMFDIMHVLSKFFMKNECSTIEISGLANSRLELREETQHLMISRNSIPVSIYKAKKLLSLVVEGTRFNLNLSKLSDHLTCLRTLNLSQCSIEEIQEGIGKLTNLRYLNLSRNVKILELPETICELLNLQSLVVSNCYCLHKLPHGIGKLKNLRYLINHGTSLSYIPQGITKLTSLRQLSKFAVGHVNEKKEACSLQQLGELGRLEKTLIITGLENVSDLTDINEGKLNEKEEISCLGLIFDRWTVGAAVKNFESIEPPPKLQELQIKYYMDKTISLSWIASLTTLKVLKLSSCFKFLSLPSLGELQSLESLYIWNMKGVENVGNEFLGTEGNSSIPSSSAFPKLKYLLISNMESWKEWKYDGKVENSSIMPNLNSFRLSSCPKLKALPDYILQKHLQMPLQKVEINSCDDLDHPFKKGATVPAGFLYS